MYFNLFLNGRKKWTQTFACTHARTHRIIWQWTYCIYMYRYGMHDVKLLLDWNSIERRYFFTVIILSFFLSLVHFFATEIRCNFFPWNLRIILLHINTHTDQKRRWHCTRCFFLFLLKSKQGYGWRLIWVQP